MQHGDNDIMVATVLYLLLKSIFQTQHYLNRDGWNLFKYLFLLQE